MTIVSQHRLAFISSASKLQDLAAAKLALEFWCKKIDSDYTNDTPCFQWFALQSICAQEFVRVPSIISRIIDTQIEALRTDLKEWSYYNVTRIFFDRDHRKCILKSIHEISLKSDCTIDHNKTAIRLLECDKLTEDEKQRIPFVWSECNFVSEALVSLNPFGDTILHVNNWYVDKVKCRNALKTINSYWDSLGVANQVKYARRSFRENTNNLIFLLPRMKTEAQNRILHERGLEMVWAFAQCARNIQYAYQTWLFIEKHVSKTQFFGLIVNLLDFRAQLDNGFYEDDYIDAFVSSIWSRAPNECREYVLDDENCHRIVARLSRCNEYFVKDLRRSLDFLLELLSNKDSTFKITLWVNRWRDLIFGSRLSHLDELMRVCLGSSEEVSRFKQLVLLDFVSEIKAKKYYDYLIKKRYHSELNAFLNFCVSGDKKLLTQVRRDLLLSKNNEIYLIFNCHDTAMLNEFDEFVGHFLKDDCSADQIKNQIVMLPENLEALYKKIDNYDLLAAKDLISCFLSSKSDLDELKCTFLNICRVNLNEGKLYNFEVGKWRKFLEWCFDQGSGARCRDNIAQFQKSIPIDEIFSKSLSKCVQWQSYLLQYGCRGANRDNSMRGTLGKCDFYELSEFLGWYFETSEAAFNFKMAKVREFKGFGKIRREFEAESDDAYIILEEWFFEGWPDPYLPCCRL